MLQKHFKQIFPLLFIRGVASAADVHGFRYSASEVNQSVAQIAPIQRFVTTVHSNKIAKLKEVIAS